MSRTTNLALDHEKEMWANTYDKALETYRKEDRKRYIDYHVDRRKIEPLRDESE